MIKESELPLHPADGLCQICKVAPCEKLYVKNLSEPWLWACIECIAKSESPDKPVTYQEYADKWKMDTREFQWDPKEDITAFEISKCIPMFIARWNVGEIYDKLPDGAKRHWIVK